MKNGTKDLEKASKVEGLNIADGVGLIFIDNKPSCIIINEYFIYVSFDQEENKTFATISKEQTSLAYIAYTDDLFFQANNEISALMLIKGNQNYFCLPISENKELNEQYKEIAPTITKLLQDQDIWKAYYEQGKNEDKVKEVTFDEDMIEKGRFKYDELFDGNAKA